MDPYMDPIRILYGSLYGSYMDPYMDPYGPTQDRRRTGAGPAQDRRRTGTIASTIQTADQLRQMQGRRRTREDDNSRPDQYFQDRTRTGPRPAQDRRTEPNCFPDTNRPTDRPTGSRREQDGIKTEAGRAQAGSRTGAAAWGPCEVI